MISQNILVLFFIFFCSCLKKEWGKYYGLGIYQKEHLCLFVTALAVSHYYGHVEWLYSMITHTEKRSDIIPFTLSVAIHSADIIKDRLGSYRTLPIVSTYPYYYMPPSKIAGLVAQVVFPLIVFGISEMNLYILVAVVLAISYKKMA